MEAISHLFESMKARLTIKREEEKTCIFKPKLTVH